MDIQSGRDFQTFDELLRWRAQIHPERLAFTFLANGEDEDGRITFHELDQRARSVAAQLQTQTEPGTRMLLLYPPGIDYIVGFLGCLYAGVIAVPAYPPDPSRLNRTLPRLQSIAADAQASLILTTSPILQMAQFLFAEAADLATLSWMATDTLENTLADSWQQTAADANDIAFLQYTSGSTRTPKGVMLSHGNLLHNSMHIATMMELTEESRLVLWLPPYHDMGLIGGILSPLYCGFSCVLMSPVDFLKRPLRWLRALSKYKGTVSGGPNFGYDLCVRKFDPAQEPTPLDLSHWRVAFNGAEPIRPDTLERFVETFAPYGFRRETFYPCYGLAEGTLIVSGVEVADPPATLSLDKTALAQDQIAPAASDGKQICLVGNGRSLSDQIIIIVDPETCLPAQPGQIGEIWVSGQSIAQGYWNRPEETAVSLNARLADTGEGPFLRTGDLGFLQDGELYVTGRRKDLIIIHGQNHYPQDIELAAERSHPFLRPGCSAAFAIDAASEERLVIVQEVASANGLDTPAIIQSIRQAVTEAHEIPVHGVVLLEPRTIFKTSSGKIQRFACRKAFLEGTLSVVAQDILEIGESKPETPSSMLQDMLQSVDPDQRRPLLISYLRHQIADLLGLNSTQLDPTSPLSAFGIGSVQAVELSQRFETAVGRELPATLAYDYPTINALCDYLLGETLALTSQGSSGKTVVSDARLQSEIEEMSEEDAALALLNELE